MTPPKRPFNGDSSTVTTNYLPKVQVLWLLSSKHTSVTRDEAWTVFNV